MSAWIGVIPLILAAVLYLIQSMGYYFMVHRVGMTIAFCGYLIGNLGLIIDYYEMKND